MKLYDYYLFDADGTLFETTELIYHCFLYSLKKYGSKPFTRDEIVSSIGLTLRKQFEKHIGQITDRQYDIMQADHMNYQMSIYKDYLKPCPGVKEALDKLYSSGRQLAVVTSRKITSLACYLQETGIYNYFSVFVTPDETLKHKPSPEPALKALELLNAKPEQCLFVGDATFDIECGNAAGIDTALVGWSHNKADNMQIKPTYVIDSMLELCV